MGLLGANDWTSVFPKLTESLIVIASLRLFSFIILVLFVFFNLIYFCNVNYKFFYKKLFKFVLFLIVFCFIIYCCMTYLSVSSCSDRFSSFYRGSVNYLKNFVDHTCVDQIELLGSVLIPFALVSVCFSNLMWQVAGGLGCGVLNSYLYHRFIKQPQIEREIEEIVEKSKGKDKSALMIHTTTDHNRAFSSFHTVARVYDACSQNHSMDRIRGATYQEKVKVKDTKYDVIVLMAHGDSRSIKIDEGMSGTVTLDTVCQHKAVTFLSSRLKKGGALILSSCETGKGDENVARAISKRIPHATVFASSDKISPRGEEFDEDMIPKFNGGSFCKRRGTTRVYQAGELRSG